MATRQPLPARCDNPAPSMLFDRSVYARLRHTPSLLDITPNPYQTGTRFQGLLQFPPLIRNSSAHWVWPSASSSPHSYSFFRSVPLTLPRHKPPASTSSDLTATSWIPNPASMPSATSASAPAKSSKFPNRRSKAKKPSTRKASSSPPASSISTSTARIPKITTSRLPTASPPRSKWSSAPPMSTPGTRPTKAKPASTTASPSATSPSVSSSCTKKPNSSHQATPPIAPPLPPKSMK